MKFNATTVIEIPDNDLLEIINDQQEWDELEVFDSLDEVPMELIWMSLDEVNYFEDMIENYLSIEDFEITLVP